MAAARAGRRWRWPMAAVVLSWACIAVGCATTQRVADGGAEAQAEERARGAVRAAESIGSWRSPLERAARMAATAEVLSWSGDAEHSTYSIRTRGEGRDGFGSSHTVVACFGVEFDAWTGHLDTGGDCPPDAPALDVEAPPVATLPPSTSEDLTAALTRAAAASDGGPALEQLVRSSTPGASVSVAADGAVGVAYAAGEDCVLGRITASGGVEVWVPPRVVVAPGELGCTGGTAAAGLATSAPH